MTEERSTAPDSLAPGSNAFTVDSERVSDAGNGDAADINALLRRALAASKETDEVDVLGGVQQRLRERSGGKFYRDGWSTARHPPVATYLVTSLIMLAIVAVIYAILVPIEGTPAPAVPLKPVQIIPNH
jgi:hypothetical protein